VLSLSEMKRMLQAADYAHDLPDDAYRKIINMSDHNNDGHLHFTEFLHLVSELMMFSFFKLNTLHQKSLPGVFKTLIHYRNR